jgi:apolipoprotein N-acyltransferase
MQILRLWGLSILGGFLLAAGWPEIGFSPILFIAWLPLLLLAETFINSTKSLSALKLYGYSYLSFLIWNIGATWWVVNASFTGALLAFLANSALMAGVFTFAFQLRRRFPGPNSAWILLPIWLSFEFLHHDWDLSWTWLTLGNGLANDIHLIQWYEFTGSGGGSLWILAVNIIILQLYRKFSLKQAFKKELRILALTLAIPIVISEAIFVTWKPAGNPVEVAVIQPNVDPYNEKFENGNLSQQLDRFLELASTVCDSNTAWLLGPETALVRSILEEELEQSKRIQRIQSFIQNYPQLQFLIGAETHHIYKPGEKIPTTARTSPDGTLRYDMFNTALSIGKSIEVYHKSKLVPGVEQMPFPWIFRFVEDFAIDLGGTTGTLGKQETRTVFKHFNGLSVAAPAVCYESVYGDFMTEYIRNGATFIAIITNDGWWGDTPGYKQHLAYAKIRAIENRRDVVRSANTGISCFINQRGETAQATKYWIPAAIKQNILSNSEMTVFSQTGDLIGKSSTLLAFLIWAFSAFIRIKSKLKRAKA